jgi:transposase
LQGKKSPRANPTRNDTGLDPVRRADQSFGDRDPSKGVKEVPGATPRYTPEFRAEAVRLVHSSPDKSIVQIARELGISDSSLHSWLKQSQIDAGEREGLTSEEREELRKLRKENKTLRQEREILRKVFHGPCRATPTA